MPSISKSVTHPSLHIRDAHDAHVLLEAVRLNILPLIKRRLVASEREQLSTGNVFVWEEAEDEGGLLRWTDGRRWSQSRMRGDYLYYEEKVETTQEERDAKAARRARRVSDPAAIIPPPTRRKDRPSKPNGLTKQTYSAVVHLPGFKGARKWHVVAYFSGNDYTHLPVIENYDYLRRIKVPPGIYLSNKTTSRPDRYSYYSDDDEYGLDDTPSSSTTASSSSPLMLSRPFAPSPTSSYHTVSITPKIALPPLSALTTPTPPPFGRRCTEPLGLPLRPCDQAPHYAPLSTEDRRVLDRFRVAF